ncbi:hypothetical protein MRX96_045659, partial [Rhipicephalus microplus]
FTDSHQSLPFEATDHEISVVLALMPTHQTKFQERSRKCKNSELDIYREKGNENEQLPSPGEAT